MFISSVELLCNIYMYKLLAEPEGLSLYDQSRTCICTRESKQGGKVSKAKSEGRQ